MLGAFGMTGRREAHGHKGGQHFRSVAFSNFHIEESGGGVVAMLLW